MVARNARAGFSLIEVMLSISILAILAQALVEAADGMANLTSSANTQALLQAEGQAAIAALLGELEESGLVDVNGADYPHVFDSGLPGPAFAAHQHVPGAQEASAGERDFGVPHAVVFLRPSDVDLDGRPDLDLDLDGTPELDGDGDGVRSQSAADLVDWDAAEHTIDAGTGLVWSHTERALLVVTAPDGANRLVLRTDADAATDRFLARDVELLEIETAPETGFEIPTNALRLRVHLRRRDDQGVLYRHRVELVVRLRNGELEV